MIDPTRPGERAAPLGVPPPDSPLAERFFPSPNQGERRVGPTDTLILHYTGMPTGNTALAQLCSPEAQVSCHYLVWEDGRVWQLVAEARRAWHAGKSFWGGETDLNSRSIGVEIVNPGHAYSAPIRPHEIYGGAPPFPEVQIAAVIALCREVTQRLRIPLARVLAHSDIAPARKIDPGEIFPWPRLYAAGVGHWVAPAPIRPGPVYELGAIGPPVAALQSLFSAYGYDIAVSGVYDEATRDVVAAFQRHFRPKKVDGVADGSTVETLRALISSLPAV